ncbi:MAG: endonuclease/exonuclease/phosphatase family protein, partial [Patescibacteria group bacterium]
EIWSAPYSDLEGQKVGGKDLDHSAIMVNGLQEISELLAEHAPIFRPHHGDNYGLLMLVKNGIEILADGEVFVHKEKGYIPEGDIGKHARNIQFVTAEHNGAPLTVINFHGLWNGQGKGDSEDRIAQSEKIKNFMQNLQGNIVLCGDFNLEPDTESLRILEGSGLRNLIRENGITSTRTAHYTGPVKFADYVLVSETLEVADFQVLPDEVSDHTPLMLVI